MLRLRKPKPWEWLVCIGIVALVGGLLWPITACACSKEASRKTACISNLKQITLALKMYSSDYDDLLPRGGLWMDDIGPYTKSERILKEPLYWSGPFFGFAYDSRVSGKAIKSFARPEKQPAVFDSVNLGRNASDPFVSLPSPGRHSGKNNVGYLDGRAKVFQPKAKP